MATNILWIYIVFLVAGGLAGFIKAGSKVSLIMALAFGLLLALCNLGVIRPFYISTILIGMLMVTFLIRLKKTRKFMPSGLMLIISTLALVLLFTVK